MFIRCITALILFAAICVPGWTQTSNATLINLQTQGRNVDFSTFSFTRPVATGTALPSTCQQGQLFFNTSASAGSNLYACTASNTWTLQGASSGSVSSVAWGTLPTWLTGTVANGTSTPALTLSAASGQTAHQVLGTGTGSSFVPLTLTAADLPSSITSNTTGTAANVTGTIAIANGGTGQTSASAAFNALSPLTALGDILYAAASGAGSRLAGNTTTTKKFLTQTGTGSASAAPAWGTIVSTDLPASITSSTTGNAATATMLASTPSACASGLYATSVTAMGNANCAQVSYSQLSGTPSLYNQTIQVNGTPQTQTTALNFAAGSNVSLSGSTTGGITTLTISSSGASSGVSGPGASTNYALAYWNGTSGNALGNSQITTDAGGDVTTSGAVTASTLSSSGSGAGTLVLSQGSPQSSFAANSVSIYAPASVASAYQWVLPANDAAGAIVSDGNGNPGHLSIAKVPQEVYSTPSGAVSGSIGPTTMYTPAAGGVFRFIFYITQVSAGAGCTSAGITGITLSFTDGVTNLAATDSLYLYSGSPTASTGASNNLVTSGNPGAANRFSGQAHIIDANGGNPISYAVTFASSGCTTQPQYEIFPVLEAL
jgi:hypothetical protein